MPGEPFERQQHRQVLLQRYSLGEKVSNMWARGYDFMMLV